ncbi:hypothetical protein HMPREF1049_0487 [Fusobacterium necrophorum subsp. funduliforme ATCC 51357]|uniref:Uncharacterized protein n=1 Tax=Fusobacterium necrophorum subsp. funduliforme Fnf 1007 TaxID=1161424 RepID=A0AAN3VUM6_9FUSO|nr:hypothetical protein HMPREF1049_0487 [Fusobacterium necrophorum subsp. funduliforme ATCC 51357]EJU15741.1 hypothetical protein HMPREF1127_0893 [Fusobacterium necrophorum subsp. funduliforme Fnf 1007]
MQIKCNQKYSQNIIHFLDDKNEKIRYNITYVFKKESAKYEIQF